jgi:4-amino-4-deoxy-L-arabinose transferase-like glycosyltransferase
MPKYTHSLNTSYDRKLLLITIALVSLIFLWGLGSLPLVSFNEARRAIPASLMFSGGNWLLPELHGELYLSKPPLYYWLEAISAYLLGGANEWAFRLPSAVAALATAAICYSFTLRKFGHLPALFSLQILIANSEFAMMGRQAEIEILLTSFCTGALLAAFNYTRGEGGRGWLILSYFLMGLGMLTKGPLVLIFVTIPLLADALYARTDKHWNALKDPLGWTVFLLVGLSWYAAVTLKLGPDIWKTIIQKDMLDKMHGEHAQPFYNYFLWLITDFFPAGLLIFATPVATWRRWKTNGLLTALLFAVVIPFLIYTLFNSKHEKYLLPIYPLIAILLGLRLAELFRDSGIRLKRTILVVGILMLSLFATYFGIAEPRVLNYRFSVFPDYVQWLKTVPDIPVYAYENVDERMEYYANRTIPVIRDSDLKKFKGDRLDALVLVEDTHKQLLDTQAECLVRTFQPYLKKGRALEVYGYGIACGSHGKPVVPTQDN